MSKAMHLLDLLTLTSALPFDLRMRLLEQERRELEFAERDLTGQFPGAKLFSPTKEQSK